MFVSMAAAAYAKAIFGALVLEGLRAGVWAGVHRGADNRAPAKRPLPALEGEILRAHRALDRLVAVSSLLGVPCLPGRSVYCESDPQPVGGGDCGRVAADPRHFGGHASIWLQPLGDCAEGATDAGRSSW